MKTLTSLIVILMVAANLSGANLNGISYAGIKIGVGHTSQDTPDEQYIDYSISSSQNGLHTEVFFNWHFLNEVALDVGLSVINRGEFRWQVEGTGNFFGSINLYPLDAGVKIKPLASQLSDHYQPWVAGGGSLIIGRGVIEGGSIFDPYIYLDRDSESATTFGWWIGAGFDTFVSTTIGLSGSVKYHKMDFNDEAIGGYVDHSGYQIAFGIAYILRKQDK